MWLASTREIVETLGKLTVILNYHVNIPFVPSGHLSQLSY